LVPGLGGAWRERVGVGAGVGIADVNGGMWGRMGGASPGGPIDDARGRQSGSGTTGSIS